MNITEQREAVRFLVTHRVSVQRACVLVQLQRATFRYQPRPLADDDVAGELRALAQEQPRYGYRRMWALLRRKRVINAKRVHRLWKRAGLQVQRTKHRQQRRERPVPVAAAYPRHVWAYDFVEDRDSCQGRRTFDPDRRWFLTHPRQSHLTQITDSCCPRPPMVFDPPHSLIVPPYPPPSARASGNCAH